MSRRTDLLELRCTLWYDGVASLLLDADVVDASNGRMDQLSRGREVWSRGSQDEGASGAIEAWTTEGTSSREPHLVHEWGPFLESLLVEGFGEEVMSELLESADCLRIVFRPLDDITARIPIEAAYFDGKALSKQPHVSIVRAPTTVDAGDPTARVDPREPGVFQSMLVWAYDQTGELDHEVFNHALRPESERTGLAWVRQPVVEGPFEGDRLRLEQRLNDVRPDLLVCSGHGTAAEGWEVGDARLSAGEIARTVAGRATVVALAFCSSATPGDEDGWSVASRLAEAGTPIVIGLQGKGYNAQVGRFVDALARSFADSVKAAAAAGGGLVLEDVEKAVAIGRDAMSEEQAMLPVLTVNPSLLTGQARVLRHRPPLRDEAVHDLVGRSFRARVFYVPGQVACFREGDRLLRVPLAVDVGAVLELQIGGGSEHRITAQHGAPPSLSEDELAGAASAWGLRGHGLRACLHHGPRLSWAPRSAALSALLRALTSAIGRRPPDVCVAALDAAVAAEWGAHDGAPRAVDAVTGQRVARFDEWPPIVVHADPTIEPVISVDVPDRGFARAVAEPALSWERVEGAFGRDANGELVRIMEAQRLRTKGLKLSTRTSYSAAAEAIGAVLVPAGAVCRIRREGPSGPRLAHADGRAAATVPDDLR